MLYACKTPEPKSYSYCLVRSTQRMDRVGHTFYRAECIDNTVVIFPRIVKEGDEVYYDAYWVDDDTVTWHGYIHSLDSIMP